MYVDKREKAEYILKENDDYLLSRLGNIAFQLENRGSYDPHLIMEIDFREIGSKEFKKYAEIVKSKICLYYESMKESGVLDTMENGYFFLVGYLMAIGAYRAIAICVAALIAKQGLYTFCKT